MLQKNSPLNKNILDSPISNKEGMWQKEGETNRNMFETMCRISWGIFWFWIHVCAKNDFYIVVPSNLDLWTRSFPQVTRVKGYAATKFQVSAAFRFRVTGVHGTDRQADRQTDGCNT